jgi:aerobic-type carbon monoxide dehydrogenase small subunit (CoxS/CutS family)
VTERIAFVLNGMRVEVETDPMRRLAAVLHDDLGLTGMNVGCNAGDCGGCTVRVDGRQLAACLVAVAQVDGCEVVTVQA